MAIDLIDTIDLKAPHCVSRGLFPLVNRTLHTLGLMAHIKFIDNNDSGGNGDIIIFMIVPQPLTADV